jgi:AcrR family transcriptional regulator
MDEAIRSRIILAAEEQFNTKGYRNMTLSELAAELGMSKKTLYLYFEGKEHIAECVIELRMKAIAAKIAQSQDKKGDPLDILKATFGGIKQELSKLNPLFIADIQKFIPSLWDKIETFRGRQLQFMEGLLQSAKDKGIIRDINPRLTTIIMMDTIQRCARPDFAQRHGHTLLEVADTLFVLFFEGLRADGDGDEMNDQVPGQ